MKELVLNGVTFRIKEPRKYVPEPINCGFESKNAIYYCYERPSVYKVAIWEKWQTWALDTLGITDFAIASYNCMQFTIHGKYVNVETGDTYNLYITKCNLTAIKVS